MGMFVELAKARTRSLDRGREEQQQADEMAQRKIQQAAMLAGLVDQGVIGENEEDPTNTDPTRYRKLPGTGRVIDSTATPEAKARAQQIVADRKQAEKIARRKAILKTRAELQGLGDDELQGIAEDDGVFNSYVKKEEPKPYAPKSRDEALAFDRDKARIAAQYAYHPPVQPREPRPPIEAETKAAGMLHRVIPAGQAINKFDNRKFLDELAGRAGWLGNWAATAEGRQLRGAGRIWATTVLRPESGATITDDELKEYFENYLPAPGDDDVTLAQKRQRRREAEEGVAIQAGRAFPVGGFHSAIEADSVAGANHPTVTHKPAKKTVINGKTFILPD